MAAVFTFNPCETALKIARIQSGGRIDRPRPVRVPRNGILRTGNRRRRGDYEGDKRLVGRNHRRGDSPIIWIDRHADRSLRHNVNINVNLDVRHRKRYCKDCSGPPPIIA